jgi:hypothetical protein
MAFVSGAGVEGGEASSREQKAPRRKPRGIERLHTKSCCNKDVTHVTAARPNETLTRPTLYRDGSPQAQAARHLLNLPIFAVEAALERLPPAALGEPEWRARGWG